MAEITYAQAIKDALSEEMRRDPKVFLLGEDIGAYGGAFGVTRGMVDEFGTERVRDTPISEAAITGAAVGAAMTGMRPIVEIMFSDFITIAMDQLVNQAAKARYQFGGQASVPMVLRTPEGSGTGAAAQHSQSVEAWILNVPGLRVVAPGTARDAKGLLKAAIRDNNPVVFFEQKLLYRTKGEVPEGEIVVPIGKADCKREGKDLSIITYGRMVQRCLEASDVLAKEGIQAEVIDLRTLRPLDTATLVASAKKTGRALVVHESCQFAGFGAEVAASICDSEAFFYLDAPVRRLGGRDVPIPYNKTLEANVVPTLERIAQAARELVRSGRQMTNGGRTMRHDLLVSVAKLYYEQQLPREIARALGISRSSVSNLLQQCRDQGIVEIRIKDSSTHAQRMQRELCSRFSLADAIVLPSDPDPEQAKVHVGRAAAGLVEPLLRDGIRIGISWGTTLYQLVRHISPATLSNVEVIQLHGGLGSGNPDIDGFGLAQKLAEKLHGSYRIMQSPIFVQSVELRRMLQQEPGISAALQSGAGADIALFGIGSNIPGISSLVRAGYLREEESLSLLSAGAIATVCGLQIGADGAVVPSELNDRLVGIDRDTLVRIPVRVGAATGAPKAEAVLAAIRGSFVTALVVDEAIASRVLSFQ